MSHFCHFWAFLSLLQWNVLKGRCCHDSLALNLSLSGCCLLSLTSVAQGTLYFVPWWTLLYLAGSLPWRFFSVDGWHSGCLGVTVALGPLAVGQSAAGVGSHRSSSVFSETKLETSFSTMSHCIFIALTLSSKVLKWALLVLYLIFGVLKGINFSLTFLTMS